MTPAPLTVKIEQNASAVRVVLTNPNRRHRLEGDTFTVILLAPGGTILASYLDEDPKAPGTVCCRLDDLEPGAASVVVLPPATQNVGQAVITFDRGGPNWTRT